jgi:ribosomal protein S18 acetylase RimI-like enzyme
MPGTVARDVTIRTMRAEDFTAIIEISARVDRKPRPEYFERKMHTVVDGSRQIVSSLVAEVDGRVVGFLMGQVYDGEFGVPESTAVVDTIGVLPSHHRSGIARRLFEEFAVNMKAVGVTSLRTLVDWNATDLVSFFDAVGLVPIPMLYLERKL